MQGGSMMDVVRDHEDASWRESMYYHYYEFPYGWHKVKKHYGIRTDRYKLIHFYNDIDAWELYDLRADPFEIQNVYGSVEYQAITAALKADLRALQKEFKDDHPEEE
jgi:arylsulfatase A-like enzyme